MRETLSCLIQLQKVDSAIFELAKSRDQYPEQVKRTQAKVEECSAMLESLSSKLQTLREERTAKEQHLKTEEEKLRKWEKRLMDSKKHHEASTLAREIDAQKRLNLEVQEEALRLLEQEETLKKKVDEIAQELDTLRQQFDKEKALSDAKTKEFDSKIKALEANCGQYNKHLKKNVTTKYENIKKRRNGLAVVPVRDGCCTGCSMSLPPQLYNIVIQATTLETCPSCQRILYWEEGLEHGIS